MSGRRGGALKKEVNSDDEDDGLDDDEDENPDEERGNNEEQDDDYIASQEDVDDELKSSEDAAEDSDDEDYGSKRQLRSRVSKPQTRAPKQRTRKGAKWDSEDESDAISDDEEVVTRPRRNNSSLDISNATLRPRRLAAQQASNRLKSSYAREDSLSPPRRQRVTRAAAPTKVARSQVKAPVRSSRRVVEKVSYAEEHEKGSSTEDEEREKKKKEEEIIAAFLDPIAFEELDDEVERVLAHRDIEGMESDPDDPWLTREFCVKWKRYSYIHCSWDTLSTLNQLGGFKRVIMYMRRVDEATAVRGNTSREELEMQDVEREMEEQLVEQHRLVERIVAGPREDPNKGQTYLVKWQGLPYAECTWETFEDICGAGGEAEIDFLASRQQRTVAESSRTVEAARRTFKQSMRAMDEQPDFLSFGKLRDYQLLGLNWLICSWRSGLNMVLADEMGLGKTVQCVAFLGYLAEILKVRGPFLVVVPLSTVPNWMREFKRWVPSLNAVVYVGDSASRKVIRSFELYLEGRSHKLAAEVLLTTYELALKDAGMLRDVKWAGLVVDEAHRLKNSESALYQELFNWKFANKLLVTGTPLQNSLRELWALLNFLEPGKFGGVEDFEEQYSCQTADSVSQLHAALRPHMLRRVIKDVEKSLPPKKERIIRVEMSPLQKQYYKWILARNFKELNKGSKGQVSLLNIITELKKCCNHPFLFESANDGYRGSEHDSSAVDRLVVTSGKMVLLDKLLRRLKETGHRVLIFSQMVRVLDIISDYMRLRGFQHQRLDGSTPHAQRHQAMEHFNRQDSADFAFLLSTRAGGLGINLATADTVVIFDSDWNPQNDLQAMSRAHRIGQTEVVNIYRFVTGGSIEEDILERAKRKMVLDHLVIQRMDASGRTVLGQGAAKAGSTTLFNKEELAAILRFGADELFKGNEAEAAEKERRMYEEDIDAILERAEVVDNSGVEDAGGASDLLSSFNVATFKHEEDDAAFWSRLIPTTERPKEEPEVSEDLTRGARLRTEAKSSSIAEDEEGFGRRAARAAKRSEHPKKKGGAAAAGDAAPHVEGAVLRVDEWVIRGEAPGTSGRKGAANGVVEPGPRVLTRRDAHAFVRGVRRYGRPSRLPDIAEEVGRALEEVGPADRLVLWNLLLESCERAVQQVEGEGGDPHDAVLDFFGVAVKASELLDQVAHMRLLGRKLEPLGANAASFRLTAQCQLASPKWGPAVGWSARDDAVLLVGVYWHGLGHWDRIAADERLRLGDKVASALRGAEAAAGREEGEKSGPKASHLETRALGLLRKLHNANRAVPPPAKLRVAAPKNKVPREPPPPLSREHAPVPLKRTVAGATTSLSKERGDLPKKRKLGPAPSPPAQQPEKRSRPVEAARPISRARSGTPDRDELRTLMKDKLKELKGLRDLRDAPELSREQLVAKTKQYLDIIGSHICRVVENEGAGETLRSHLWQYVSSTTKNAMSGEKLASVYMKISAQNTDGNRPVINHRPIEAAAPTVPPVGQSRIHNRTTARAQVDADSNQESGEIVEDSEREEGRAARHAAHANRGTAAVRSETAELAVAEERGEGFTQRPSPVPPKQRWADRNHGHDAGAGVSGAARGPGSGSAPARDNRGDDVTRRGSAPNGPLTLKHKSFYAAALNKQN